MCAMPPGMLVVPPPPSEELLVLEAPPSKSVLLRALTAAALAGGGRICHRGPLPRDVQVLVAALRRLGAHVEEPGPGLLRVTRGPDLGARDPVSLDAGEGAAPARFLLALAGRLRRPVTVDGAPGLRRRPMGPLLAALNTLGARTSGGPGLPATVHGPLRPTERIVVEAHRSSQFASALLLVLPGAGGPARLELEGPPVSAGYLDLTRGIMGVAGVHVDGDLRVAGETGYRPFDLRSEADWSGATVLLAAAAFLGRSVRVPELDLRSQQPDSAVAGLLPHMGVHVESASGGVQAWGAVIKGGRFDIAGIPDAASALAALGALAAEETQLCGAPHLRHKESDRIQGLVELLLAAGVEAAARRDGLVIRGMPGSPLRETAPARLPVRGDHRLAMAGALLGLRRPVLLDDATCVEKSFPGFFAQWPGAQPAGV